MSHSHFFIIQPRRAGFSAIELLTVLAIIFILVAISTPTALTSIKRSRVSESGESILRASNQARLLARLNGPTALADGKAYGVLIVAGTNTAPGYATVIYGDALVIENEVLDASSRPIARFAFHRSTSVFMNDAAQPAGATFGWFCQPNTGYPIRNRTDAKPVEIGVVYPSATFALNPAASLASVVSMPQLCTELSLRSLDGRFKSTVRILSLGLGNVESTP